MPGRAAEKRRGDHGKPLGVDGGPTPGAGSSNGSPCVWTGPSSELLLQPAGGHYGAPIPTATQHQYWHPSTERKVGASGGNNPLPCEDCQPVIGDVGSIDPSVNESRSKQWVIASAPSGTTTVSQTLSLVTGRQVRIVKMSLL